jgi:WD repeat-containing protein mio
MDYSPIAVKFRKDSLEICPNFVEKAEAGYSLVYSIQNLESNKKLSEHDPVTFPIWHWLNYCKSSSIQPEGLLQIIEKAESSSKDLGLHKVFHSEERKRCLAVCDWDIYDNPITLASKCNALASKEEMTHCAMLAIFSLNNSHALEFLNDSCVLHPILSSIDGKEAELAKFVKSMAKHEVDPYIRTSLWFLLGWNYYKSVLDSLSLMESVGFALRYLNDAELKAHLASLIKKGYSEGQLQTLVLSGFTNETPELLQNYYEATLDLQTVSILSIFAQQFIRSEVLDSFVSAYKSQLIRMELFTAKCLFEIEEAKLLSLKKENGKVMRCYYCGNSIAICDILSNSAIARRGDPQSISQPFLWRCPSCSRSLPRCCVCLSTLKSINPHFVNEKKVDYQIESITWCEKCHHGGHTSHILEWFSENQECPAFNCGCECACLDSQLS